MKKPCNCIQINASRGHRTENDCPVCWHWLNNPKTWKQWGYPPICIDLWKRVRDEQGNIKQVICNSCDSKIDVFICKNEIYGPETDLIKCIVCPGFRK